MGRKVDLGSALKSVGDSYIRENPADLSSVRADVERWSRRGWWRIALVGVGATASLVVAFVALSSLDLGRRDATPPAGPASDFGLDLAGTPQQVEARGDAAYVALDGSVQRIDHGATAPAWSADLSSSPSDLVLGSTGLWATLETDDAIVRLDPESGQELQRIELQPGSTPSRLTVGARALRVVTSQGVVRVSLPEGETKLLYSGDILDIAMGHSGFWVVNSRGAIFAIDPDRGTPVAGLRTETRTPGGEITFARGTIFYGRPDSTTLVLIDETTGLRRGRIQLPGTYVDLDAGAQGPWVLSHPDEGGSRITSIDAPAGELGGIVVNLEADVPDLSTSEVGIWLVGSSTRRVAHLRI